MADRDDLQPEDEDDGGGVVKSFLEHLEDLRWTLIKSAAAIAIGMFVCLFGVKTVVAILKWPLARAQHRHVAFIPEDTNQIVTIKLGEATLSTYSATTNHLGSIDLGTNRHVTLHLVPGVLQGSNMLTYELDSTPDSEVSAGPELVFMDPADPFLSWMHVAFFGGLILASPAVLYFIGQFVMPALKIKEKKYFMQAFWFGTILFLTGVSFAYFVVMPAALKFAELFAVAGMGVHIQNWLAPTYFSFLIKFMLGMGLGFELPVVLLALVKIGILDYAKLTKMRRYMVVGNLVLGALLTTPEVFTQVFMAIALQLLFEISVWIAWYWEREARRNAPIDV
ncbi:MAG TPA: twin-arginine translocase subunit TatC [Verrucomicrobiae bacterium]|jgi:sec-independent protein translocase protein TatC|nr:twin-arginine translocase subunit TatC [Verrucomicrobiae bacterium]